MFVNRNSLREINTSAYSLASRKQKIFFFLSHIFVNFVDQWHQSGHQKKICTELSGSVFTMRLKVAAEGEGSSTAHFHVALFFLCKAALVFGFLSFRS